MTFADLRGRGAGAFEPPRALYLHVPFCSTRCAYCDFHSFGAGASSPAQRAAYADALVVRAGELVDAFSDRVDTVFIGGGTPTALEDEAFGTLLAGVAAICARKGHSPPLEWSVEANPESLTPAKLSMMAAAGVTRLSIGVQSMDDAELRTLGRGARHADNMRAMELALRSGLAVSADLMTALPRPTSGGAAPASSLEATALALAASGVGHLSIYDLVVEEGTRVAELLERGELRRADEDSSLRERTAAEAALKRLGFGRYEVSNYALPGSECAHNQAYWSMRSYLGAGSGAVSTLIVADSAAASALGARGGLSLRVEEGRNLGAWLEDPDAAAETTWISAKDSAFEMAMMGLRTARGLDLRRFGARFGAFLGEAEPGGKAPRLFAPAIERWKDRFTEADGFLRLDGEGLDLLNPILVDLLSAMDSWA
ncbi:coproporphyrinogen III oxidase family protein [bacterium]|nr:coproporphyrinogen III oxidase family protein [bacterium]